tara:strand:+ start:22 stop:1761 length:1740 start_codon:yes stop_codon:yes gene_type:complete
MTVTFQNDIQEYGNELRLKTELRQTVINADGGKETVSYKAFIKKGEVKIWPVDDTGKIVAGSEPIFENGEWKPGSVTKATFTTTGQGGANKRPSNVAFAGIAFDANGNVDTTKSTLHEQLAAEVRSYSSVTNEEVAPWAKNTDLTPLQKAEADLERLREEGYVRTGNSQTDMRRSMQWTRAIRDAENKVRIEEQKVENNQQIGGTDNDMKGASGAAEKIKYAFDRDDEIMFLRPVVYPQDLSMSQDHMVIQCYSYEPPYSREFTKSKNEKDGFTGAALGAKRGSPLRKKLGAPIMLPMPNQMQDSNPRQWEESNLNNAALDAIRKAGENTLFKTFFTNPLGIQPLLDGMANFFQLSSQQAGRADIAANRMSQLLGDQGFDVSSDQILARTGGVIANSNTELLFAGVSLRSFKFQWLLTPRDENEAHICRMMIRAFKEWSAPRKMTKLIGKSGDLETTNDGGTGLAGGPSYFLGTPNVFRLRYLTDGNKPILGANMFKTCALRSVDVNYTPEGQWMAYAHGQPTSYSLALDFAELEPIYNTDYQRHGDDTRMFSDENKMGDLMPIFVINQDDPKTSMIGY